MVTGTDQRATVMNLTERQSRILAVARRDGRVDVDLLAREFDLTTQTIRRDLNDLCLRGLLTRVHGGAVPANSLANVGYEERRSLASLEKRRIGERAAALLPERCSLMMNIGTTVEQVARALYERSGLMIVTNNLNVVNILSGSPTKSLILAGGEVRQSDGAVIGEAAVEFMRGFRVDYAVIGASALDEDGAVMDFDLREVSVARAILDSARHTILVADNRKFERSAPVRICGMDRIDTVVTDLAPPDAFRGACERAGTQLILTENALPEVAHA